MPYETHALNRHWLRAIAAIVRTESEPARVLARKLGDEVMFLPLAKHILKQREEAIAAEAKKRERIYDRMIEAHNAEAVRAILGPSGINEAARG